VLASQTTAETFFAQSQPPQPTTFSTDRGVMIPQRKRTRAADRAARIKAEREQHNTGPPPTSQPQNDPDPPLF